MTDLIMKIEKITHADLPPLLAVKLDRHAEVTGIFRLNCTPSWPPYCVLVRDHYHSPATARPARTRAYQYMCLTWDPFIEEWVSRFLRPFYHWTMEPLEPLYSVEWFCEVWREYHSRRC